MNLVDIKVDYGVKRKPAIRKMELSAEERFMRQPFHELGIVTLKQLSQLLNGLTPHGADWRDVADMCGFKMQEIQYIMTLDKQDGSNTMEFFKQLSSRSPCPTIGQLHTILVNCKRLDAAGIIVRCFQEYSAVLQAENAQPLDLSTSVKSRNINVGQRTAASHFEASTGIALRERSIPSQFMTHSSQPDKPHHIHQRAPIPISVNAPHVSPKIANGVFPHAPLPISPTNPHETQMKVPLHAPPNQRLSFHPHEHDERMRGGHFVPRDHHGGVMPNMVLPSYADTRTHAPPRMHHPMHHHAPMRTIPEPIRTMGHEHGMEVDDTPPPLMPILRGQIGTIPDTPPPPYDTIPREQPGIVPDWREQNVPSRCESRESSECFTPDHIASARCPVEDPQSSMDTEESDIVYIKKRLDDVHMKANDVITSEDKITHRPLDDKASKEKEHKRVLAKLRQSLIKDKTKSTHQTSGANMECDDQPHTVNSQLPTVIDSNWAEDYQGAPDEDYDSAQSLFLSKEKSATYPRYSKDKTSTMPDMMELQQSLSATPKLDSVPFGKLAPSKLFITYGNGFDQEEGNAILKDVRKLVTIFRANNFDVNLDSMATDDNARRQLYAKFKGAEFILVCISPSYKQQVKSSDLNRSQGARQFNNAKVFYKYMQKEFKKNDYHNKRFIPILIANSDMRHAPDWFVNICPRETFYKYPEQLKNIMYHISKPEKLMKRFVEKQQLMQRPPWSLNPPAATPPHVQNAPETM